MPLRLIRKITGPIDRAIMAQKNKLTLWWWKKRPPQPSPEVVEKYFGFRMPEKSAAMVANIGYEPGTPEQKYLSGNPNLMNWNGFKAAEFLIQCGHIPIIAVFQQWFRNSDDYPGKGPPPAKMKPGIMMNLWLTKAPFEQHREKVSRVANMIAHPSMIEIMGLMLENWPPATSAKFIELVTVPTLSGGLKQKLPLPGSLPIYLTLKKTNPERFNALLDSLPGDYKGNLMKEMGAKEKAAKEGEQNAKLWEKQVNRIDIEKTLGEILLRIKEKMEEKPEEKAEENPEEQTGE